MRMEPFPRSSRDIASPYICILYPEKIVQNLQKLVQGYLQYDSVVWGLWDALV